MDISFSVQIIIIIIWLKNKKKPKLLKMKKKQYPPGFLRIVLFVPKLNA